ncbi:MAG TPA: UDP kinase [Firmicutes bacterium]|nr:UDP kinase [Bacillota bacterium]
MRSESIVKEDHSIQALFKSFKYALDGILTAFKIGRNIKVQCCIAIMVVLAGVHYKVSALQWIVLFMMICQVLVLEMVNTSIERVVDLASPQHHPYAKIAKDVAAGAVLFACFIAVLIGIIIFVPYIFTE